MAIHRNAPAAAETGRARRAAPGIAKGNLGTGGDVLGSDAIAEYLDASLTIP